MERKSWFYIKNLFILQKKSIRVVCKAHWNAHTTPLFRKLGTLKLDDKNKLQTGCFMYTAMNNQLPSLFSDYFIINKNIHHYFTRQSHNIHQFALNTSLRKLSIKNFGSSLWNSLPILLKTTPSMPSFKHTYKKILISNYI